MAADVSYQMNVLCLVWWSSSFRQRYAGTHNKRNWIRCMILSQWSSRRSGVMCSFLRSENTRQVAAFRTDCSRWSWASGNPARSELKYWSLLTTVKWMRAKRTSSGNELRTWRNAAKRARTVAVIYISFHGDVSINYDPEVAHWARRHDEWLDDANRIFRDLVLAPRRWTPQNLRVDRVQLQALGFRPSNRVAS
jgi:hypothetical protein